MDSFLLSQMTQQKEEGQLNVISQRCESYMTQANKTKKQLCSEQMQQEIIIQMCKGITKGKYFRAIQPGIFYKLVPELFTGNHASAEQSWRILSEMRVQNKKKVDRKKTKNTSS